MLATPSWLTRLARLSGKAGRQGGVVGLSGGGQGLVAGRGEGGGLAGWSEGDGSSLSPSKECSGVNVVT